MSKIAIVYWSATGNTEEMAKLIAEGAKEAQAEVVLYTAEEFSLELMKQYEKIAFGCPSMGVEELEDTEFEPMFSSCKSELAGKKIVLFGAYGWGDGEWMRNWEEVCRADGAVLVSESVITNECVETSVGEACREAGRVLVNG